MNPANNNTDKNKNYNYLLQKVCSRIAPSWSLENFVASNPYWGLKHLTFEDAARTLLCNGNIPSFMPLSYYLKKIESQEITSIALQQAIHESNYQGDFQTLLKEASAMEHKQPSFKKMQKFSEFIDICHNTDISAFIVNETSARLSVYFDKFGDYYPENGAALFKQWHKDAQIDLMPELFGLKNFRKYIKNLSEDGEKITSEFFDKLNLNDEILEEYLHTLLLGLVGWSSYLSSLDWDAQLQNKSYNYLPSLVQILLSWEMYLYETFAAYQEKWKLNLMEAIKERSNPQLVKYIQILSVLQRSMEISLQKEMIEKLSRPTAITQNCEPTIQMAFCIDVRSEIIRRHIEELDNTIQTIGVAGFFGLPVEYHPINTIHGKKQCPVLIPFQYTIHEKPKNQQKQYILQKQVNDALRHFKVKYRIGVVTGFGYVSPLGLFYLPKLISDNFGWTSPYQNPKKIELNDLLNGKTDIDVSNIPFDEKLKLAHSLIQSLNLQNKIASLVVLTGHGSTSVNNPHATALECGACGGHSGEINALLGCKILNHPEIRQALASKGINIPDDTLFIAALHDTTTDEIKILRENEINEKHFSQIQKLKSLLQNASQRARKERVQNFQSEYKVTDSNIMQRAKDWSQVRPEWGLAGCHSFIIAPRSLTKSISLDGKVFLHDYDYSQDNDFTLLETLMTAPMVVGSWINLQYYASVVAPDVFGSGHKPLHNVVSGLGVLEGSTGDLRIGLPFQSIHNGFHFMHVPVRLNVFIKAPIDKVYEIIDKHLVLQQLINNKWLYLFIIEDTNTIKEIKKVSLQKI